MYLFVLEFLGTTELMVILVVALIVFGPRKLPQLSRSLGKSLTEFRRASEDFKRTWEREVALDDMADKPIEPGSVAIPPMVTPAEYSIGRTQSYALPESTPTDAEASPEADLTNEPIETPAAEPVATGAPVPTKRDWL
ncbi:MAG: twin-arginine translocase TatA/TatE family subunit [Pyrinomonadaceae bacterium]